MALSRQTLGVSSQYPSTPSLPGGRWEGAQALSWHDLWGLCCPGDGWCSAGGRSAAGVPQPPVTCTLGLRACCVRATEYQPSVVITRRHMPCERGAWRGEVTLQSLLSILSGLGAHYTHSRAV